MRWVTLEYACNIFRYISLMKYYRFSLFPIANQPRQVEFYKWLLTEQILIGFIDTIPMTKLSNVGNYNSSFRFFFSSPEIAWPTAGCNNKRRNFSWGFHFNSVTHFADNFLTGQATPWARFMMALVMTGRIQLEGDRTHQKRIDVDPALFVIRRK